MKTRILVPLLVGLLVTATALGAEVLTGYLANLQFNVVNNPSEVYASNMNLGTIYSNEIGTYNTTTSMTIGQAGVYSINVLNSSVIDNVFGWFNITIKILNSTADMRYTIIDGQYTSYLNPHNVTMYLSPGSYTVQINLSYAVLPDPQSMSYDSPILVVYYQ